MSGDLDDPHYARFAWRRYRQIMTWMTAASALATAAALAVLHRSVGPMPLIADVFAACGIFFSLLLGTALMGLVFLSSGSGHDDLIDDPTRPEEER